MCCRLYRRGTGNGSSHSGVIRLRAVLLIFLFLLLCLQPSLCFAEEQGIQFRADHYERDLRKKSEKGIGKAWIKSGDKEISADEIELDREAKRVIANGNVHLKESNHEFFCNRAIYSLDGREAILEEVTLLSGQMVVTGTSVTKLGPNHYEIKDGIYTNCNTIPITDRTANRCLFDWKIFAHRFDITLNGYVFAYDVILYSKDLPLSYLPFFMAPAKAKRQTGILLASVTSSTHLGTGFSLPFFWAINSWQDLTLTPTYFTKAGIHLSSEYNYIYSQKMKGRFSFFYNAKSFNALRAHPEILTSPFGDDPLNPTFVQKNKSLGFAGELAFNFKNTAIFDNGLTARQSLNYVTDPFYVQDYPNDIGLEKSNLGSLRSLITFSYPTDQRLFYGGLIHHQSLIVSTDTPSTVDADKGADKGSLTQLPKLGVGQKLTDLFSPFLSLEWDTQFINYWRPGNSFDNNMPLPGNSEITPGADYHEGDFIREGQRLRLEPRLVGQLPILPGVEVQPSIKASLSAYHFELPESTTRHRELITTEIPLSFYLSRVFEPAKSGANRVGHLIQPRLVYGSSLYSSTAPNHPFFSTTHPPFDVHDLVSQYEYFRLDLIQRFRLINEKESVRFLTFQLSNQYNSKIDQSDPRLVDPTVKHHWGPLQGYLNLTLNSFSATLEGYYQWEKDPITGGALKNESSWTSTLNYDFAPGDSVSLSTLMRNSVDPTQDEQLISLGINKSLPIFVNLSLLSSYSAKRGELRSYEWGAHFASKPSSCWSLSVLSGKTQAKQSYARFLFQLNFGGSVAKSS